MDSEMMCDDETRGMWVELQAEACIALSNIACDKAYGVLDQLIESQIYPDIIFPLYRNPTT